MKTYLYIQDGFAAFGAGDTEEDAIKDACEWLSGENGDQGCSVEYAKSLLKSVHECNHGDMTIISVTGDRPENWDDMDGEEMLAWVDDVAEAA